MNEDAPWQLRGVKDRIARSLLGAGVSIDPRLGGLTLRPHQLTAVGRLLEIIASHRGAMLADAVGLGKTYVALAIARRHVRPFVVCPAALRSMWRRATAVAGLELPIVTMESLSRGALPPSEPDLILVDEAHHFRTPGTQRYESVARLARRARVLLISATPLHNSRRDLEALFSLFAGSAVGSWSDEAIARLIVRRDETTADQWLPVLSGPHALSPGADDDCLDAILSLPPAIPAADEGVAHALATISLLHLWTSSRAALRASVRRRLARALALRNAIESGTIPTADELSAWRYADDSLQMAFPFFPEREGESFDRAALETQLDRFSRAARALLDRCAADPDPDVERAGLLRGLRMQHAGERIVAFSRYAHTVLALGRQMRAENGVAVVTADGARIASGATTREEVLAQFAADAPPAPAVERIDLLLTTDLLSEGIDLRGASVIVHLDLPWNPARLEQRVGRSRRLGSRASVVHVYTFVPPTAAERMLELQRRLMAKVRAARSVVGGAFDPFGCLEPADSPVSAGETLRSRLTAWLDPSSRIDGDTRAVAAVCSQLRGWIAVVNVGGSPRLIGDFGDGIHEDARVLLTPLAEARDPAPVSRDQHDTAMQRILAWMASREASAGAGTQASAKRAVLDRLTETVARAPRHRRPAVVAAAQRTRAALTSINGIGAERILSTLARSTADDAGWLQSVEAFSQLHASEPAAARTESPVAALLLFVGVSGADGATPE